MLKNAQREDEGLLLLGAQLERDLLQLLQHRQSLLLGVRHQVPPVRRLQAEGFIQIFRFSRQNVAAPPAPPVASPGCPPAAQHAQRRFEQPADCMSSQQ